MGIPSSRTWLHIGFFLSGAAAVCQQILGPLEFGFASVDPDAVHEAHGEHDHDEEGASVRDERKREPGDRQERDGHPDVLEHVEEDLRGEAYGHDEA